ncbi:MAG: spore coat protein [Clostridia bacterium]
MNLTNKELIALEDQLGYEQVLTKKYRTFASECQDAQLKAKCNQIADKHQQHFNTLMGYLQ